MALDLTTSVPRSPFDELAGYAWLPRLIDKARAHFAGTLGDYSPYPCPADQGFLKAHGLDAVALGELIKSGADDAMVAAYVKQHAQGGPEAAAAFRLSLHVPPTNPIIRLALAVIRWKNRQALAAKRPGLDLARLDSFSKMIALEEGHPVPGL